MEVATARVAGTAWAATDGGAINRLRSDRSLAERFRAGDEAAFATIYERHRARVSAICIGVLGSREDALDATQEVFATVAVKLRETPPRELRPWLAKVARNAAVDIARKRRPTAEADEAAAVARASNGHAELQELVSALRELPEQQRTALVMRELGGWSYEEIGASLGVDSDAVNGLIARARLGLRAQREAAALVCSAVRESLAGEEDGRRRAAPIRRHLRTCEGCSGFNRALQSDAQTLRALLPGSGLGVLAAIAVLRPRAALIGGVGATKMALTGAGAPVVAVCAIGVCATGLTALDALPAAVDPVRAEKKGPAATGGEDDAGGPTALAVTAATQAADSAGGANAPAGERETGSFAEPGPEGRVFAGHPEREDLVKPERTRPREPGPRPSPGAGPGPRERPLGDHGRSGRRHGPGGDGGGSPGPRPDHREGSGGGPGPRHDGEPRDSSGPGGEIRAHDEGGVLPPPPEPLPDGDRSGTGDGGGEPLPYDAPPPPEYESRSGPGGGLTGGSRTTNVQ